MRIWKWFSCQGSFDEHGGELSEFGLRDPYGEDPTVQLRVFLDSTFRVNRGTL